MSKEEMHEELCNNLHEMYVKKNQAYGDSFSKLYKELGVISCVTQISHKYNRLVNLVKNPEDSVYESVVDTLTDLANYALMTVLELESEMNEPVEELSFEEKIIKQVEVEE